jgi:lysozyme family protein
MNFEIAILRVLGNEGGYTVNPSDPGGETQWGISKRSYPDVDIKSLTREAAQEIYRRDFWAPIHGDEWPLSMSFQILDFAVNAGIETAKRKAQTALNLADDGVWGPVSLEAMRTANPSIFTARFAAAKIRYYTRLTTWPVFGAGWMNRIAADLDFAGVDLA